MGRRKEEKKVGKKKRWRRGRNEGRQGRRLTAKEGFLFFESERESNRRGKLEVSATAKTRITVKEKLKKEGGG